MEFQQGLQLQGQALVLLQVWLLETAQRVLQQRAHWPEQVRVRLPS
jgi:hypothetical protein